MAIESYEQIMARLNGQQAQAPTAASDFANYVQTLLLNPNPQGNMMTDAEAYRADPFRRQNAINASLDEALKKKQAEEAAKAAAAGGGMFGMGGSGDSGNGGRNYWADREAELSKTMSPEAVRAQILQEQVQAREKIPAQLLELLMPGMTAIKGIQSLFNPTPTNYATPWAQMTPAEKMYAANNQAPVSDSMIADAMRSDAIQNAIAAQALQQQGISLTDFGGSGDSGGGDSWSGSSNNDTFDSGGAGTGYGNVSGSDYGSYW